MTPAIAGPLQTRALLYGALLYLVFVIYGSLVPLDFHARDLGEAWQAFSRLPYLDLGIESRADWVANILLFVPLTFLWLGMAWHPRSRGARIMASVTVFGIATALSVVIEFTQLFFPPRTTSQNDIAAETIGALIGILVWWRVGEKVMRLFGEWAAAKNNSSTARLVLYLYLFFLFGYNLLPLDLTLSPVEMYHKWQEGKIVLMPFGFVFKQSIEGLYGTISDVVIWVPVAFLLNLSTVRSSASIVRLVVGSSALLEFLQLFVYSRVSSVTQIILSGLGAVIGVFLARLFFVNKDMMFASPAAGRSSVGRNLAWFAAIAAWVIVLCLVFWYPFDFRLNHETKTSLIGFFKVPFIAYYYGTEFRAATEVLHKTGFFLPFGLLLALAFANIRTLSRLSDRTRLTGAALLSALMALSIEFGQAFLPGKNVDVTDWMLESGGAIIGYLIMRRIAAIRTIEGQAFTASAPLPLSEQGAQEAQVPSASASASASISMPWWRPMAVIFIFVMVAVWFITQSAYAPYNVRKLLATAHPYLSLPMLTGSIFWTIGFPAWITLRGRNRSGWIFFPAVVCHCAVAWILIRSAVPIEMIEKVAASPILGWPWEWELMGRFSALFAVFSIVLTLATTATSVSLRLVPAARLLQWLMGAAVLLPALYWIIVANAATDNLTELLANQGSTGDSVFILLFMLILFFTGTSLAAFSRRSPRPYGSIIWLGLLVILSFPLAYVAVLFATEHFIIKYGKVFSALQFLLSSDRTHYADTPELALRYALFHCSAIAAVAVVQQPFFSSQRRQLPASSARIPRRTRRRRSRAGLA